MPKRISMLPTVAAQGIPPTTPDYPVRGSEPQRRMEGLKAALRQRGAPRCPSRRFRQRAWPEAHIGQDHRCRSAASPYRTFLATRRRGHDGTRAEATLRPAQQHASQMPRMADPGRGLPGKDDGGNQPTPLPSQVTGAALQVARTGFQTAPSLQSGSTIKMRTFRSFAASAQFTLHLRSHTAERLRADVRREREASRMKVA